MAIVRFFSPYEITDPNVVSEKIEGYRYTRQIPTGVESRLRFPDCPSTVQAGIDPSQDYNFTELKEISKRRVFLNDDISTRYKDILVMSSDDRDTINKALEFVHGNFDYQEYFSNNTPEIIKGQFNIAFDAKTGEDNIGDGYVNFKDKELNNIVGTFSRNSTATRINSSGVLETVNIDMPRIDWSSGKPKLLIERYGRNSVLHSQDFNNAVWVVNDATKGITVNFDSENTGNRIFMDNSSTSFIAQSVSNIQEGWNGISCWMKSNTPNAKVHLFFKTNVQYEYSSEINLSTEWERYLFRIDTTDDILEVGIINVQSSPISQDIDLFGFQFEDMGGVGRGDAYLSSYIPTTNTTAVRNGETLVFDNLEEYFIDNQFSFYSKCQTYDQGRNGNSDYLEARDNQNNFIFLLWAINNDNRLSYRTSSGYIMGVGHNFNESIFYNYDGTNANVVSSIYENDEAISQPEVIDEIQISTQDDVFEIEQYILFPTALSIGEAKYITN